MAKRPFHGPGKWVCWDCFLIITDLLDFKPKMRIIDTGPPDFGMDYRAKVNAPCKRCGKMILIGQKAQKMTLDTPFS